MRKRFIVISGLPCSGKTTLGRQLAPLLNLPVIDNDDILDSLFESRGVVATRKLRPRAQLTGYGEIAIGPRIDVDTAGVPALDTLVRDIYAFFETAV